MHSGKLLATGIITALVLSSHYGCSCCFPKGRSSQEGDLPMMLQPVLAANKLPQPHFAQPLCDMSTHLCMRISRFVKLPYTLLCDALNRNQCPPPALQGTTSHCKTALQMSKSGANAHYCAATCQQVTPAEFLLQNSEQVAALTAFTA